MRSRRRGSTFNRGHSTGMKTVDGAPKDAKFATGRIAPSSTELGRQGTTRVSRTTRGVVKFRKVEIKPL